LFWQDGNLEAATESFDQALNADSRLVLAQYSLGRIYTEQGEFNRATLMFDRCVNLLNDHLTERITLPITDELAKQQLFRCYIGRADAYLRADVTQATLDDLALASQIVEDNPDLFITNSNKDNPPAHAERITEMYVLYGRLYTLWYSESCATDDQVAAIAAWRNVQRLDIDPTQSAQRLWLYEAATPPTCATQS
jgi:tetratricopeptide (TPR) repeat protein